MSKNFKNMMSQLRISKDEGKSNNSNTVVEKHKNLLMKANNEYVVRFIPYINNDGEPKSIKEFWYHFYENTKYSCKLGCQLCTDKVRKTLQKTANVQLISTTDSRYKPNDYFILTINQNLYTILDDYEKNNSMSLFDVYDAPELTLKPTEVINDYKTKVLSFNDSFFSETYKSLTSNIEDYEDEQIISFLKEFTYDLDKEVEHIVPYEKKGITTTNETLVLNPIVSESINNASSELINSIASMKKQIDIEMNEDLDETKADEPVFEKTKPIKKVKESKIIPSVTTTIETQKTTIDLSDQESYINDFLDTIKD